MPDPFIDIVFSGPPSEPATFIEVENPAGASISVGEWLQRDDGYWVLRIPQPSVAPSSSDDSVFVVATSHEYEGYFPPEAVFTTRKEADEFAAEKDPYDPNGTREVFELTFEKVRSPPRYKINAISSAVDAYDLEGILDTYAKGENQ